MSDIDPMEILRRIAAEERAHFEPSPHPEIVLARVRAGITAVVPEGNRRRRRLFGGLAVAVLGVGGGVAWAISRHETAREPLQVVCYEQADLDSSILVPAPDGSDAVTLCDAAWRTLSPQWGPAPPLVGCVLPSGRPGVFPGDDQTCAKLGLVDLTVGLDDSETAVINFKDAVAEALDKEAGCVAPARVTSIVQNELDAFRLTGWKISPVGTFDAATPCAIIEFQVEDRTVVLHPIPDMFSGDQGG
ncbi:MAG: hypothetical protein JWM34_1082 [Ilumatobacteraceae bacterium]|nr:hypothetical protein [Ilumatobacteraceae bacterium]